MGAHPLVGGGELQGEQHHCCWPCYCDAKEWVALDTKKVQLKEGPPAEFTFMVIGNPCVSGGDFPEEAPELHCENGQLKGATLSQAGHPIIGMFFKAGSG